jgi:para-nitrobenzyl esterase
MRARRSARAAHCLRLHDVRQTDDTAKPILPMAHQDVVPVSPGTEFTHGACASAPRSLDGDPHRAVVRISSRSLFMLRPYLSLSAILISLALGCASVRPKTEVAAVESALTTTADAVADNPFPVDETNSGALAFTSDGVLQGQLANNGTRLFLGIPYAQPPVGAMRFRPPLPARPWRARKTVITPGPACPQLPGTFAVAGPQSEDCLSLNVYAANRSNNAPVLVFIHGGIFVTGAGSQFDAQRLAESSQVIVVTINYRLGALGFLALPELDAERPAAPSGNDALRDQQLALGWVQRNIRAFGGDPARVTVFGQSAGAVSACLQMVSPLSRNLASRFAMQSGACDANGVTATLEQARATSARVVSAFCAGRSDVLSCLRAVPASVLAAFRLQNSILDVGWLPVVNPADPLLPDFPRALIDSGNYNKGAIITGSNARELGLFQALDFAPVARTIAELNAIIDARFGPVAALVRRQYAAVSDADANRTLVRLGTDLAWRCPARALARRTSAQGSDVFLYHFEEGDAFPTSRVSPTPTWVLRRWSNRFARSSRPRSRRSPRAARRDRSWPTAACWLGSCHPGPNTRRRPTGTCPCNANPASALAYPGRTATSWSRSGWCSDRSAAVARTYVHCNRSTRGVPYTG